MNRKFIGIVLSLVLVVGLTGIVMAADEEVKNPDTYTFVTISDASTLDPHFSYDTASSELIYQVYENLIHYKGSSVFEFTPLLSTEVPSVDNGLISPDGKTYTFPIREGVEFSNGNPLTPEDVKYSFIRGMIQDRTSGPVWMLYEPLFGTSTPTFRSLVNQTLGTSVKSAEDVKKLSAEDAKKVYAELDKKITIDGNNVTFHLAAPYPPFLNILAKGASWAAILDKEWSASVGAWDGNPETIFNYHDPVKEADPLFDQMMGTGPFVMVEWVNGDHTIFSRNDNYWGEPANFKTFILKNVDEWSTRKLMLLRGDADQVYVPKQFRSQVEGVEGITVSEPFPVLQNLDMLFNWTMNPKGNDNIGSGKLDGKGVPPDFFADEHVRRAFSYSFNYKAFIEEVRMNESIQLRGPIVSPLLGYDENSFVFNLDLEKAEEEFKKAFDGELWEKGFEITIIYNSGNDARQTACDMLKTYIEQINPKFKVNVRGIQWSTYLDQSAKGLLPANFGGWLADFPDPHNFAQPFLDVNGYYAQKRGQNYIDWANEVGLQKLIVDGIEETDPATREELYKEIQRIAMESAVDIWIDQPIGVNTRRSWVKGWYPNAMRPGVDPYILDK